MPSQTYHADVTWKGEHWGEVQMGNGPLLSFSAPPDAHGHKGVLTPEDAFVAAVNACVMMMFLWSVERFKLDLVSYECRAEGTKLIELDRTEIFTRIVLKPRIAVRVGSESPGSAEKRIGRALESARKYSLVANSIKSDLVVEPEIMLV